MNKSIYDKLKIIGIKTLRCGTHLFSFFPIEKGRVLLSSYLGESYSCNPKYISEYLQKNYPEKFEIVWAFKDTNKFQDISASKIIKYKSISWFYYTITANVIIGNNAAMWIPRRKGQLIIDTWHGGGCYKKVAADNKESSELAKYRTKISGKEVNLYLSSSKYFSDNVVRKSFMYDGEILSSGMPRNDVLFVKDINFINKIRTEIAAKYNFSSEDVIVLFAPTWRKGRLRSEQLDIAMVKRAVSSKVGKSVVVLGRGHHTESGILEKNVIDVSDFPDMQKLLIASDILITDYSSSMWDYSFTEKPCFLFTPDLEIYEKTPGFDRDIHSWGFPVCETNDQLESEIYCFDQEDYLKRMETHHASLGNYENGTACRQVCDYINKFANC